MKILGNILLWRSLKLQCLISLPLVMPAQNHRYHLIQVLEEVMSKGSAHIKTLQLFSFKVLVQAKMKASIQAFIKIKREEVEEMSSAVVRVMPQVVVLTTKVIKEIKTKKKKRRRRKKKKLIQEQVNNRLA